jgi:hypothetical protein
MQASFKTLIIVMTGAFFRWMFTGFKGTFNEQMSHHYDNDSKYSRNFWTGIAVFVLLFVMLLALAGYA